MVEVLAQVMPQVQECRGVKTVADVARMALLGCRRLFVIAQQAQ